MSEPRTALDASLVSTVFLVKAAGEEWSEAPRCGWMWRCRQRYIQLYGDGAPIVDAADRKSAVYLVCTMATFDGSQEWFSIRFVPAAGAPALNDDLTFHCSRSREHKTLVELMAEAGLVNGADLAQTRLFSQSRICAATPVDRDGKPAATRGRYAGLSWRAALRAFLDSRAAPPTLTVQMAPSLVRHMQGVPLRRLEAACGLPGNDIQLDRKAPRVREMCYRFPGYFLDPWGLARLVSNMLHDGQVTSAQVCECLPPNRSLPDFLAAPRASDLRDLHPVLEPEAVRVRADELVGDATRLWITDVHGFERDTGPTADHRIVVRTRDELREGAWPGVN